MWFAHFAATVGSTNQRIIYHCNAMKMSFPFRYPQRFISRTVLIKENNVEEGVKMVNRLMGKEGLFQVYRLNQFYEKPHKTRRRENYEKAKAIYGEDMSSKIKFVMRTNRVDPWIGRL